MTSPVGATRSARFVVRTARTRSNEHTSQASEPAAPRRCSTAGFSDSALIGEGPTHPTTTRALEQECLKTKKRYVYVAVPSW